MKHAIKYTLALNAFVFLSLIMLTLPMNIYADPTTKCPCFTVSKLERNFGRTTAPIICRSWSDIDGYGSSAFNDDSVITEDHFLFWYGTGYEVDGDYFFCASLRASTSSGRLSEHENDRLTEDEYEVCLAVLGEWCD